MIHAGNLVPKKQIGIFNGPIIIPHPVNCLAKYSEIQRNFMYVWANIPSAILWEKQS